MPWVDSLLNIMQAGIKGEAGIENREAFMNIMKAMLVNESVYMPVMHAMIPVVLDGVPMFSEIWVDPDEESSTPGSSERGIKLLIKFDLKDVGFFDVMMYYEKGKMDMLIHYPEELSGHESEIREGIRKIMSRNHLELEYLAVEQGEDAKAQGQGRESPLKDGDQMGDGIPRGDLVLGEHHPVHLGQDLCQMVQHQPLFPGMAVGLGRASRVVLQ